MISSNDSNPYQLGVVPDHSSMIAQSRTAKAVALTGALFTTALSFPIAGFLALVFRFPVPLGGIVSGPRGVIPAMIAVAFYGGLMGGFILLGAVGAFVGIVVRSVAADSRYFRLLQISASAAVALVLLFVLATLDWYIGPW